MSGFFAADKYWDLTVEDTVAMQAAVKTLSDAAIPNAMKDARALWVAADGPDHRGRFQDLVAQRAGRVPLSHLVGFRAFFDHSFLVTPEVLDPRPETEVLVEAALAAPFARVLDLGTGSGCILLSLLAARPNARGTGADLSPAALEVAARNARQLGVQDRAEFVQSDWFAQIGGQYDLIVANPPYIAADEMVPLQPEVREHEPHIALTDGADGLTAYRDITAAAAGYLFGGGRLIVEIGPTQGQAVAQMMHAAGLAKIRVLPDLDGRDRVVEGHLAVSAADRARRAAK